MANSDFETAIGGIANRGAANLAASPPANWKERLTMAFTDRSARHGQFHVPLIRFSLVAPLQHRSTLGGMGFGESKQVSRDQAFNDFSLVDFVGADGTAKPIKSANGVDVPARLSVSQTTSGATHRRDERSCHPVSSCRRKHPSRITGSQAAQMSVAPSEEIRAALNAAARERLWNRAETRREPAGRSGGHYGPRESTVTSTEVRIAGLPQLRLFNAADPSPTTTTVGKLLIFGNGSWSAWP